MRSDPCRESAPEFVCSPALLSVTAVSEGPASGVALNTRRMPLTSEEMLSARIVDPCS